MYVYAPCFLRTALIFSETFCKDAWLGAYALNFSGTFWSREARLLGEEDMRE